MPTCKHRESGESAVRLTVSPDVCCQGVQTDSDDIFSKARLLSDDSKVHYCTGLPVCEMLIRFGFQFCFGIVSWWGKTLIYCKSLIIVLLKLRLCLGFLDNAYRLGVPVASGSQKFQEILDLITARHCYKKKLTHLQV